MFTRDERNPKLDVLVGIASLWISFAFFIDAWSHEHEPVESFFTWSHGLIYGGMALLIVVLVAMRKHMPQSYRVPMIGVPVFLLGGLGDMIWHHFFGIEEGVDIILSPTHETIGFGLMLVSSAPIFSALRHRRELRTLVDQLPMLLSLASWLVMVHFATGYAMDPAAGARNAPPNIASFTPDYLTAEAINYYKLVGGVVVILLQSFILSCFVLFAATRFDLKPGALTLMLVLGNTMPALPFTNESPLLFTWFLMSAVAGALGDVILARIGPGAASRRSFRIFAGAVPAAFNATYVFTTAAFEGVWWDWSVLASMIIFGAVIGLGLSLLIMPAKAPA